MTEEKANLQREVINFLKSNEQIEEWWDDRERKYMMDVPMMLVGEVEHLVKNFNQPTKWKQADVSGRSELLFAFIAEVKKEFADQNWDYLDFIANRVLKANNSY